MSENCTLKPDADVIREAARTRGITRLTHFTPLNNLIGIAETGALLARDALLAVARERRDWHLLDYIAFNDSLRLDRHTGHISLSVQHPNSALFTRFRQACPGCEVWCVLSVTPDCLLYERTLFAIGNAASSHVRHGGLGALSSDFLALFNDQQTVSSQRRSYTLGRSGLGACYSTDPQAEVLVPEPIAWEQMLEVAFETEQDLCRARSALRIAVPQAPPPLLAVRPDLFRERMS